MRLVLVIASMAGAVLATAGALAPASSQEAPRTGGPPAAVVYRPPLRGAPGGRIGGGTRGAGETAYVLSVIAPGHTGLTTSEQPALYWFISTPSTYPIEVTVVDPRQTDPVLELRLSPPIVAGMHRVRLAEHGVRLAPGVAYQWYVAVVPDGSRRSKDILAGSTVERVAVPPEVTARLAGTAREDLPRLYAEAGLWYDAVAALGELLEASPRDPALLAQRAALLRQAGLPEPRTAP